MASGGVGGLVSGILILSFYSVIAGICLNYIGIAAMPNTSITSAEQYSLVTASAPRLLFWHTLFIGFNIAILAAGVIGGIERMVRLLMPTLFILMIIMVLNAMINGDFIRGFSFLFSPNFSDVDATTFLRAMGQAFFSLSLGMGSIMCYGSYMPKEENIFKTSLAVAGLDTLIAILAGLAIFPIIFAYGMEPGAGPGLVFISLLSVFVDMPLGNIIGPAFFTLLSIAALSSAISLLEPSVAYFEEEKITSRFSAALILGLLAWFIGIGSVLSFNEWSEIAFIGDLNFLDSMDYLANQFLMPIGGMLIAIFAGWFLKPDLALDEFSDIQLQVFNVWRFFIRYISPASVAAVFIYQLIS